MSAYRNFGLARNFWGKPFLSENFWEIQVKNFSRYVEVKRGKLGQKFSLVCHVSFMKLMIGVREILQDVIAFHRTKSEFEFAFGNSNSYGTRSTQNTHKMTTIECGDSRNTRMRM